MQDMLDAGTFFVDTELFFLDTPRISERKLRFSRMPRGNVRRVLS